jgi:hypothetical protein
MSSEEVGTVTMTTTDMSATHVRRVSRTLPVSFSGAAHLGDPAGFQGRHGSPVGACDRGRYALARFGRTAIAPSTGFLDPRLEKVPV